jgi:hypothetical protein
MKSYLEHTVPDGFDPDEISWITPNLGVTDWEGAEEASLTGCYVINVAPELESVTCEYDNITIGFDNILWGLEGQLDQCARHMRDKIEKAPDIRIVVHCAMGMERSPLAIAWYLHKFEGMDLNAAYKKLADARPIVIDRRSWI